MSRTCGIGKNAGSSLLCLHASLCLRNVSMKPRNMTTVQFYFSSTYRMGQQVYYLLGYVLVTGFYEILTA